MDLNRELARRELTAYALAKEAGLTPTAIYQLASGKSQGRRSTWRAIEEALARHDAAQRDRDRASVADLMTWPAVLIKAREHARLDGWDGTETGGWLLGLDLGDRLVVEEVAEEPDAERTARTLDLDLRRGLGLASARPPGWRLLGDFHNHPPGSGWMGSAQDRAAWQSRARYLGRLWVGIVVTESESRSQTDVSVYLTSPAGEVRWINSPLVI